MRIKGIVIKGKSRGQKLGFPTVNLALEGDSSIESGVYAGVVYFDGKGHKSAIFIGKERNILEAYILDFKDDLYGKEIKVELGIKIREAQKFEREDELKKQIAKDVEIIKKI